MKIKTARGADTQAALTAAAAGPTLDADGQVPLFFPCLMVEGQSTSDGRTIEAGALSHRALPLTILAQVRNPDGGGGHDGAEVIGHLTELYRTPGPELVSKETQRPFPAGTYVWQARGVADPDKVGTKLLLARHLTGNSGDLSELDYSEEWDDYDEESGKRPERRLTVHSGKIAATTLVPIPAFADAYVEMDGAAVVAADDLDLSLVAAVPAWRSVEVGDDCMPCAAGEQEPPEAAPSLPPLAWFTDPGLVTYTPLTVEGSGGRVFGHIAPWGACHVGISNACVRPPRSHADYTYFNTGSYRAQEDGVERDVAVGSLTMGGGHADGGLGREAAARHYDDTATVVAYVAAGEDAHGIWVSGVAAELSDQDLVRFRASSPSGDWRGVDGNLELIAALMVNHPGYVTARSRVASGAPVSLVAAGYGPPTTTPTDAVVDAVYARLAPELSALTESIQAITGQPAVLQREEAMADLRQMAAREALTEMGIDDPFSAAP